MEELIIDYESGALDAAEVRLALAESLNKILKVIFYCYIHPLISPEGKN
jgi:xylose isomerase